MIELRRISFLAGTRLCAQPIIQIPGDEHEE